MKTILLTIGALVASAPAALAGAMAYQPDPPSASGGSADGAVVLLLLLGAVIWAGQRNTGVTRDATDLTIEDDDTIMKF